MDQRYDPAFQRGHTDQRSRPNAVDSSGRRSRLASLDEVAPQLIQPPTDGRPVRPPTDDRFDDGPRARVEPFRQGTPTGAAPEAGPSAEDLARWADEDEEARGAASARAAQLERALWAVGLVLAVGGGLAIWFATSNGYRGWNGTGDGPPMAFLVFQTILAIGPCLVTVGLATIVALLFRRLHDHDRRSRP
ncbi:hypothetical protein ITJ57_15555 [Plantibacter sp. VKM Ac-2880]|uniref:hypothetical protein n=1 Tax=Plantibacter sp. VKM Ac-2880 TaxID=2783827 RepID=UPI00188EBD5A|nr:hypothetical protein [Plantibacter sp. VKM Ac-2880]MBF4570184.1 hypothetical protein [Plantibacter sp. VKM Ac-2880]